jgi:hypothetical protein
MDGNHALVVGEVFAGHGLAQQCNGMREFRGVDVGAGLSVRGRGVKQ